MLSWPSEDESRSVQNKKIVLILFDYGNVGGLKWDPGYGRVGIRAEGGGWCACEFKNPSECENKL